MKTIPLIIVVIALAVCAAGQVFACSCVGRPGTVAEEYAVADVVFEAEVVNIWFDEDTWRRLAIVTAGRVWKGIPAPSTLIVTGWDSAACGVEFLPGGSWLIFGTDTSGGGGQSFHTHICTLTTPSEFAAGIIAELESVDVLEPTWGSLKAIYR